MKRWFFLIGILAFAACGKPLSVRMVGSEMSRCPDASYLDGMEGVLKWNYTTGLELDAFLDVHEAYPDSGILNYVNGWYDRIIAADGTIGGKYSREKYNIDHLCPGCALDRLREIFPERKYEVALDTLRRQLSEQPRTEAGAFWHKAVYPGQVWLDGLFMAEPFYARTAAEAGSDSLWSDIALQFSVAAEKTYDPETRLYRHAWDETRSMFWADPVTGQSAHCWGRALGWYTMALVDVLESFPAEHPARAGLETILCGILDVLPEYADPETGMWFQVLDSPEREGNYVEATCSAMFTYAYLKADRLGLYRSDARRLYKKLVRTFLREDPDGTLTLERCCAVAGLGGKQMRSGTFEYYIGETVTENDPKGIGPFIRASLEYEKKK
ncbi:MAG: glycoside hydrolase family 88 protein [Bacteroidales bacterium]|nr:glycoside hydrolase family 88 protein [Bacteroidales bacterium]